MNGVAVQGVPSSFCQLGRCGGQCGDALPPSPDPVTVPATGSLTLEIATAPEVHEIAINLFAGDTPTTEPLTFILSKDVRRHVVPRIVPGVYYLSVLVRWSRALDAGDQSYAFRIIVRGT